MKQRTKEIIISVISFLTFYIVVSQYILPVLSAQNHPAALFGWISLAVQVGVVFYLLKKKLKAAVVVGAIFIVLQLILQIAIAK